MSNAHLACPYTAFQFSNQSATSPQLTDNQLARVSDTEKTLEASGQIFKATDGKETQEAGVWKELGQRTGQEIVMEN